jgi:acyl carrier protein
MDTATVIESLALQMLGVTPERLRAATSLEEVGIDSLGAIDLVFAIESQLGVLIDADALGAVHSLQDLVDAIER